MEIKEIHNVADKFKKGKLYLYNSKLGSDYLSSNYNNLPVISLSINKNYPTWVCLFPNGMRGGLFPEDLKDITLKKK